MGTPRTVPARASRRSCDGGSMGWLLDNREHLVDIGPGFFGFDFTDLIPREGSEDDGACTAAAAVIMHQLAGLMDGRRIAAFFDECRFYMEPLKRMIDDYTLTGRKKELMCWLVAQQPEHFTDTEMGHVVGRPDADQDHLPRRQPQ